MRQRDSTGRVIGAVLVAALLGCGDGGGDASDDASDARPADEFLLESLMPPDGAVDVPVNTSITAVFDAPLALESVHADSFFVTEPGGDRLAGGISGSADTAVFEPAAPLAFATDYTVTLTRAIADETGRPLRFLHTATFTTERDPAGPPPAPTGVTAQLVDDAIDVSWTASPRAEWHNVYWSVEPGVTATSGTRVSPVGTALHFTSITRTTTYYFVVTAENASWESEPSAEVSVTVPGASPPWTVVALDDAGDVGLHSSIAVGDGAVAIAYRDVSAGTLEVAVSRGGEWSFDSIDTTADVDSALRIDTGGVLHLLYADGDGSVRYATDGSGSWDAVTVEADVAPTDLSLALGDGGDVHAAYCLGPETAAIGLAHASGGAWSIETPPYLCELTLAIDVSASGALYMVTYHRVLGMPDVIELWLTEVVTTWPSAPVASLNPPLPGAEAPLAFGGGDTAHIAYHGDAGGVAYLLGTSLGETIEASFVPGPVPLSLAVDAGGAPHVTYALDDGLYYATRGDGGWSIERVDGPTTGADNAVAVDAAGIVHISYYDATSRCLKYATRAL